MPDAITHALQLKAQELELKISSMDRMMSESITEQRQLVRGLNALTNKFDVYIERHDQVSEANKRLWNQLESQEKEIDTLKEIASANQPVIDGIRNLQSKLIWLIISTVLSPAAIIGALAVFKVGT